MGWDVWINKIGGIAYLSNKAFRENKALTHAGYYVVDSMRS